MLKGTWSASILSRIDRRMVWEWPAACISMLSITAGLRLAAGLFASLALGSVSAGAQETFAPRRIAACYIKLSQTEVPCNGFSWSAAAEYRRQTWSMRAPTGTVMRITLEMSVTGITRNEIAIWVIRSFEMVTNDVPAHVPEVVEGSCVLRMNLRADRFLTADCFGRYFRTRDRETGFGAGESTVFEMSVRSPTAQGTEVDISRR